jgi:tyrosine-protein kinase Etk/Wzc
MTREPPRPIPTGEVTTEVASVSQFPVQVLPQLPPQLPPHGVNDLVLEFDWRRTINVLFSARWVILAFVLGITALGILFCVLFPPTYTADGLIQIQQDKDNRPQNANGNQNISYDINGNSLYTEGEIAVLQSRMVLIELISKLNLLVDVRPNAFPIIGGAFIRSNSAASEPVDVPDYLRHFAWGGEQIDVPKFEVPSGLEDKKFLIRATERGFDLIDPDGRKILDGQLGAMASSGNISILVTKLKGHWGTTFQITKVSLANELDDLTDHLKAEQKVKDSGVIQLSFKAKSAQVAAAVINNVESIYLRRNTEWRSARAADLQQTLNAQIPQLKDQVDRAQRQLNAFQLQHGSVDVTQETQLLLQRGVELETSRLALMQQRDEAVQRFTKDHPMVITIDDKIASLDTELQKLKGQAARLPLTQQEMLNRTRDLDVANQLYTAMLNTIQQQQVIQAGALGNVGGNVRVVDDAIVPEKPSFPKFKLILPLSFLLGVMFGITFALGRHYLVNAVYDEAELRSQLGLATLGRIPFSRAQKKLMSRLGKEHGDSCLLASAVPDDPAVESLRKLRSALYFATQNASNNVIAIAGPTAGIGKSFVALNLASLLAFSGKRVVLMDADFYSGNLYKMTQLSSSPGLTDFIREAIPPGGILQPTGIEGLTLIAQGTRQANSQELLLHELFATLLKFLESRFDYVVVDTPGNLGASTATVIGRLAGCTLMVLRAGGHSVEQIEESYRLLTHAGANVRGVVFNEI